MQEVQKTNVKAIVSIVLAVLSVLCCCVWWLSMMLGIAAVVVGILGYRDENPSLRDLAIAGIVVGAVGVAIAAAVAIMQVLVYFQMF